jgi:hypothetical protein
MEMIMNMVAERTAEPTEKSSLTFHDALDQAERLARQNLPETLHERLSCAVALVKGGQVLQMDDGAWEVESVSVPGKQYHINGTGCPCEDASYRAPQGRCKHVLGVFLARKALALMATPPQPETPAVEVQDEAPEPEPEPPAAVQGIDPRYVVSLHGKDYILYSGLVALAHQRGLRSLKAEFITVTETMALAKAEAVFADGRVFQEASDSAPNNVGKQVRPHWPRMALVRAKARCLRDALNVSACSVEELGADD